MLPQSCCNIPEQHYVCDEQNVFLKNIMLNNEQQWLFKGDTDVVYLIHMCVCVCERERERDRGRGSPTHTAVVRLADVPCSGPLTCGRAALPLQPRWPHPAGMH